MNERTYEWTNENYIPLSINTGGIIIIKPRLIIMTKKLFMPYLNNKGTDQPTRLCNLRLP